MNEDLYDKVTKRFHELKGPSKFKSVNAYFEDDRAWMRALCEEISKMKEESK